MSPQGTYYVLEAFCAISQGSNVGRTLRTKAQELMTRTARCGRARSHQGLRLLMRCLCYPSNYQDCLHMDWGYDMGSP